MDNSKVIEIIADRVHEIREDVSDIKVTLAANTASLQEHMRRTSALEAQIEPLKAHVATVNTLMKIVVGAGVLLGVLDTALKLMGKS